MLPLRLSTVLPGAPELFFSLLRSQRECYYCHYSRRVERLTRNEWKRLQMLLTGRALKIGIPKDVSVVSGWTRGALHHPSLSYPQLMEVTIVIVCV